MLFRSAPFILRGVDISPIFLLLGLMFLNNVVIDTLKDLVR